MGAVRDQKDRTLWRWVGSGEVVSVSFWDLPQGTEDDCARYDGGRGWLWSDTPCSARLNFICQHRECRFARSVRLHGSFKVLGYSLRPSCYMTSETRKCMSKILTVGYAGIKKSTYLKGTTCVFDSTHLSNTPTFSFAQT